MPWQTQPDGSRIWSNDKGEPRLKAVDDGQDVLLFEREDAPLRPEELSQAFSDNYLILNREALRQLGQGEE